MVWGTILRSQMTFVIVLSDQNKGVTASGVMELKTRSKRGMAGCFAFPTWDILSQETGVEKPPNFSKLGVGRGKSGDAALILNDRKKLSAECVTVQRRIDVFHRVGGADPKSARRNRCCRRLPPINIRIRQNKPPHQAWFQPRAERLAILRRGSGRACSCRA